MAVTMKFMVWSYSTVSEGDSYRYAEKVLPRCDRQTYRRAPCEAFDQASQPPTSDSDLADVLVEDLPDLQGTLLRAPLLVVFVIDERDAEASLIAFGPFKVTVITTVSIF